MDEPLVVTTAFVDRDGTINRKAGDGDYVKSCEEFELLPRAQDALALLSERGLHIIVVTNQRGVALGRMSAADVDRVNDRMLEQLRAAGARVDAVYVCPHALDACDCRKPKVGLFMQAKRDFPDVSFEQSIVIGDTLSDMTAAARIGARSAFIATSHEPPPDVDVVVASLWDAAKWLTGRLSG